MSKRDEVNQLSDAPRSDPSPYDAPNSFQNVGDTTSAVPVELTTLDSEGSSRGQRRKGPVADAEKYDMPQTWSNLDEVAATSPVENVDESPIYVHHSLEQARGPGAFGGRDAATTEQTPAVSTEKPKAAQVSKLATQIYTWSYLIFFAIFGTMARVGLTALTTYPGEPVIFSVLWANFGGSLVMGFLSEDRMLFRDEWGTPTYDQLIEEAKRKEADEENDSGQEHQVIDLVAAKKAHLTTKKTIPLYIGLATGFCGSFTSFSAFIRDIFLALANSMATPGISHPESRDGGYSFMALVAVIITTIALSLSGLVIGAHLAIVLEKFTPSIPFPVTRKVLDPLAVFLGWGCWIGAVIMAAVPPNDKWRGELLFSLIFGPLGCLLRFYLSIWFNGKIAAFPLGTFAANMLGTAVLGMSWDIAHIPIGGVVGCQVLQGIEDGFCGCLTTISTWVAELSSLKRRNAYIYGTTSVVVAVAIMVAVMGGVRWTDGFATLVCTPP